MPSKSAASLLRRRPGTDGVFSVKKFWIRTEVRARVEEHLDLLPSENAAGRQVSRGRLRELHPAKNK
jgi:hypothetical protein